VEFYARNGESALNRFILRQSKKFLQRTKLLFFCTLPQSQRTLINEQASRTHEQARMRTEGRSDPDPLKNKKNTPKRHLFSPACYACFISIVY
jgi:hypothetical protein